MKIRLHIALLLLAPWGLAACGGSEEPVPNVMGTPWFAEAGTTSSFHLDTRRPAIYQWDGAGQAFVSMTPDGRGLDVPARSRFLTPQPIYSGMRLHPETQDLALLANLDTGDGSGERMGLLVKLSLATLPVTDTNATSWTVDPGATGPYAAPGGEFAVVEPDGVWRRFPSETTAAGPFARTVAFSADGVTAYAINDLDDRLLALRWPDLATAATVDLAGAPMDLDVDPASGRLAVITSNRLQLYDASLELEDEIELPGFPWRVHFLRAADAALVAVLNLNGGLYFFSTEGELCGVDTDALGFRVTGVTFLDEGELSDPRLGTVTATGCASRLADQPWEVRYEGVLSQGATVREDGALIGSDWLALGVRAGDPLDLDGQATTVTGATATRLYFEPVTQPLAARVSYTLRAGGSWVVRGSISGVIGRVDTGETLEAEGLALTIEAGSREPTRNDRFVFQSDNGVSPVNLSGTGTDIAEDRQGRLLVPLPAEGIVRAVEARREGDSWVLRNLYAIP